MREAKKIQFSGMNKKKVKMWVCSLQPSDHGMGEKVSACASGLQNSPLLY